MCFQGSLYLKGGSFVLRAADVEFNSHIAHCSKGVCMGRNTDIFRPEPWLRGADELDVVF
jgi:hypothetical protein